MSENQKHNKQLPSWVITWTLANLKISFPSVSSISHVLIMTYCTFYCGLHGESSEYISELGPYIYSKSLLTLTQLTSCLLDVPTAWLKMKGDHWFALPVNFGTIYCLSGYPAQLRFFLKLLKTHLYSLKGMFVYFVVLVEIISIWNYFLFCWYKSYCYYHVCLMLLM